MKRLFLGAFALLALATATSNNIYAQEIKDNAITLSSRGTVAVAPDMATMSISISYTSPTMKESKSKVDNSLKQVLDILKREKIEDHNIKTTSLGYDTEHEYRNGKRVKIGQRARLSMSINVMKLSSTSEKLSNLLDKISNVSNVEINNISFGIESKDELYKKSRELAFQKAYEKAKQYAELSGRRLGKVLSISEFNSDDAAFARYSKSASPMMGDSLDAVVVTTKVIPSGEEAISTDINVVFSLD